MISFRTRKLRNLAEFIQSSVGLNDGPVVIALDWHENSSVRLGIMG